jgi:hypothetical protein
MFMGYSIEQWVQLSLYGLLVLVLFVGSFALSCIITNKFLHKRRKNNFKIKNKKRSYFIDIA